MISIFRKVFILHLLFFLFLLHQAFAFGAQGSEEHGFMLGLAQADFSSSLRFVRQDVLGAADPTRVFARIVDSNTPPPSRPDGSRATLCEARQGAYTYFIKASLAGYEAKENPSAEDSNEMANKILAYAKLFTAEQPFLATPTRFEFDQKDLLNFHYHRVLGLLERVVDSTKADHIPSSKANKGYALMYKAVILADLFQRGYHNDFSDMNALVGASSQFIRFNEAWESLVLARDFTKSKTVPLLQSFFLVFRNYTPLNRAASTSEEMNQLAKTLYAEYREKHRCQAGALGAFERQLVRQMERAERTRSLQGSSGGGGGRSGSQSYVMRKVRPKIKSQIKRNQEQGQVNQDAFTKIAKTLARKFGAASVEADAPAVRSQIRAIGWGNGLGLMLRRNIEAQVTRASAEASVQREVEAPVQREVEAPVQREVEAPVQREVEAPVQREVEAPVQREVEAPVQREVEASVQREADAHAEVLVQKQWRGRSRLTAEERSMRLAKARKTISDPLRKLFKAKVKELYNRRFSSQGILPTKAQILEAMNDELDHVFKEHFPQNFTSQSRSFLDSLSLNYKRVVHKSRWLNKAVEEYHKKHGIQNGRKAVIEYIIANYRERLVAEGFIPEGVAKPSRKQAIRLVSKIDNVFKQKKIKVDKRKVSISQKPKAKKGR